MCVRAYALGISELVESKGGNETAATAATATTATTTTTTTTRRSPGQRPHHLRHRLLGHVPAPPCLQRPQTMRQGPLERTTTSAIATSAAMLLLLQLLLLQLRFIQASLLCGGGGEGGGGCCLSKQRVQPDPHSIHELPLCTRRPPFERPQQQRQRGGRGSGQTLLLPLPTRGGG